MSHSNCWVAFSFRLRTVQVGGLPRGGAKEGSPVKDRRGPATVTGSVRRIQGPDGSEATGKHRFLGRRGGRPGSQESASGRKPRRPLEEGKAPDDQEISRAR